MKAMRGRRLKEKPDVGNCYNRGKLRTAEFEEKIILLREKGDHQHAFDGWNLIRRGPGGSFEMTSEGATSPQGCKGGSERRKPRKRKTPSYVRAGQGGAHPTGRAHTLGGKGEKLPCKRVKKGDKKSDLGGKGGKRSLNNTT